MGHIDMSLVVCSHVDVCLYSCIRGLEPIAFVSAESALWVTAGPRLLWDEMSDAVSDWIRCCRSAMALVCFELQFHRVSVNRPALSLSWISKQEIWQNSKLLPAFFIGAATVISWGLQSWQISYFVHFLFRLCNSLDQYRCDPKTVFHFFSFLSFFSFLFDFFSSKKLFEVRPTHLAPITS